MAVSPEESGHLGFGSGTLGLGQFVLTGEDGDEDEDVEELDLVVDVVLRL